MIKEKMLRKKALAILLALVMLAAMLPIAASAESADYATAYIGITSDVHGSDTNVAAWMDNNGGSTLMYMVFGGDTGSMYWKTGSGTNELGTVSTGTSYSSDGDQTWKRITDRIAESYPDTTPLFTMGNHDWWIGSTSTYNNADLLSFQPITGQARTGVMNDPAADGFTIYTFGAPGTSYSFKQSDIDDLSAALSASDPGEPFLIISHYPLHYGDGRTSSNAGSIINLLNDYAITNNSNKIFFFWGHNHHWSSNTAQMNKISVPGDTIVPSDATSTTKTIYFTYANSGHMGVEHNNAARDGTGELVAITDNGSTTSVTLSLNEKDGTTITTKTVDIEAVGGEISSVSITGINAPAGGAAPDKYTVVSPGGVTASVAWYSGNTIFEGTAFEAGVAYTAQVTLTPPESKVFSSSPSVTINGNTADFISGSESSLTVSYTFPAAPDAPLTYTKAESLTDGHEYAIVMDGAAMNTTARSGSTSYYSYTGLGYTNPDISGDKNTLTFASAAEAAAATWTFTSAGADNQWYIGSQGSYLNAPGSRALKLAGSDIKTAWTFGSLNNNLQLYAAVYDEATSANTTCKLFYGSDSTVDFFYLSVNNDGNLILYEKTSSEQLPKVDHIAITNPPVKTTYTAGESFDPTGLQVTAYYADSTSAVVTDFAISPGKALSAGITYVTVTYRGKTAVQTITVNPAVLYVYRLVTSITSGSEYAIVFDGDVAMSNIPASGTASSREYTGLSYVTPTIMGDYLIFNSEADASAATWKLTADGGGWDIQNGAQYVNATAARTMALGAAQAWTYGTLSSKGIQLYVSLSSTDYNLYYGGTSTVDFIYPSTNNNNTLTLYEKKPVSLESIAITPPPSKTIYSVGDSFDPVGMVVTATFSDGSTADVTDYTTRPVSKLALTDSLVTVSFLGKTASTPVNVFPAGPADYSLTDTIEPGERYVIVSVKSGTSGDGTRALQSTASGTNYLAGTSVTLSSDNSAITSSISNDMIWTAEVGSAGVLLQNSGKYLQRGSSTNYLVAAAKPGSTNADWTYSDSNKTLSAAYNGTAYYLYYSQSSNAFRANSSAQSGESIYLYKQNLTAVTLDSITVTGAVTSYTEGQSFDPTGMVVTAHFSDGTINDVINYSYSPSGSLSPGDKKITVSYCGKEASVEITVAAVSAGYTVTWINGVTQLEQDIDVAFGSTPSYDGAVPEKDSTDRYTYTFLGWNTSPDAVTGSAAETLPAVSCDTTYYAIFSAATRSYTVTWINGETQLERDTDVAYGSAPSYDGAVPEKASTDRYTYTFLGWSPDPEAVTGSAAETLPAVSCDTTYYAIFSAATRSYTVTWISGVTQLEQDTDVAYGSAPSYDGAVPEKASTDRYTYTFAGWSPDPEAVTGSAVETLPAVSCDTTYYTIFSAAARSYTIKFYTDGGSAISDIVQEYNTQITAMPISTKAGFTIEGWYTEESLTSKVIFPYTIKGNTAMYAKWTKVSEGSGYVPIFEPGSPSQESIPDETDFPLKSIPETAWYYPAIRFVLEKGLLDGIYDENLLPDSPMTRAMFVTMLYRMENDPAAAFSNSFSDVLSGKWYTDAVAWAAENGIVKGYGNNTFGPDDALTREQLVVILYRYASYKDCDVNEGNDFNFTAFTDAKKISGYAVQAFGWACDVGIIHGRTATSLAPRESGSVAEAAKILMNFHDYISK